jgi:hypothetical protein
VFRLNVVVVGQRGGWEIATTLGLSGLLLLIAATSTPSAQTASGSANSAPPANATAAETVPQPQSSPLSPSQSPSGPGAPHSVSDPMSSATRLAYEQIGLSYRELGLLLDELLQKQSREIVRLKKRVSDLEEYLKKCGDRPGCTVPVK